MSGTWVRLLASARVKGVSNLGLRLVHHALYANLTQLLLRHRLTPLWSPPAESQEYLQRWWFSIRRVSLHVEEAMGFEQSSTHAALPSARARNSFCSAESQSTE